MPCWRRYSSIGRVTAQSEELVRMLRAGDRRALARAITLVESTRLDHRAAAEELLSAILPQTGSGVRIGVTGPPGAGKSTFIERFGLHGLARGRKIAVLAVDPASKRGGGAILADKTRMAELGRSPAAFIRPSSAAGSHGGAARHTREAILLCEATGFDAVIVESVGAGQSETAVADMTDMFVLILAPAAGDEWQGLKRGVVELADLVLVNKADGELAEAAARTTADYATALRLVHPAEPEWAVPVRAVSALEDRGVAEIWDEVAQFRIAAEASGAWLRRRCRQQRAALWDEIEASLLDHFRAAPAVAERLAALEAEVITGRCTPGAAAARLLAAFLGERPADGADRPAPIAVSGRRNRGDRR
jgi:LAO/AO transport system kinase